MVFPIENEALLRAGFLLKLGQDFKLKSSTPITPMPENAMRPTAILWQNLDVSHILTKIVMIGGRADRNNLVYDL